MSDTYNEMRARIALRHQLTEDDLDLLTATDEAALAHQAQRLSAIRSRPAIAETYPRTNPPQAEAAPDELEQALTDVLNPSGTLQDRLGVVAESPQPFALNSDGLERALLAKVNG